MPWVSPSNQGSAGGEPFSCLGLASASQPASHGDVLQTCRVTYSLMPRPLRAPWRTSGLWVGRDEHGAAGGSVNSLGYKSNMACVPMRVCPAKGVQPTAGHQAPHGDHTPPAPGGYCPWATARFQRGLWISPHTALREAPSIAGWAGASVSIGLGCSYPQGAAGAFRRGD